MDCRIVMDKKRTNKEQLTPTEVMKFKAMLLAKRNEILKNVTSMEGETLRRERSDLSSMPIHMADLGTDNYDLENTLELMDSERKLLAEIDGALARIEEGTYGICEGSGRQIPKVRLEAIPWAKYCVEYANLLERGLVKKGVSSDYASYDYRTDDEKDIDIDNNHLNQRVEKP